MLLRLLAPAFLSAKRLSSVCCPPSCFASGLRSPWGSPRFNCNLRAVLHGEEPGGGGKRARLLAPDLGGVVQLRGFQSRKYLLATSEGQLAHSDEPRGEHLFALVPGVGKRTGLVRLQHLATGLSIFLTLQGWLGVFEGDYPEHYWKVVEVGGEVFVLEHHSTQLRLFSNEDGRLGYFSGELYDDQLFGLEDRDGRPWKPAAVHGCYGLQDTGFLCWDQQVASVVYTDAFHAGHYAFDADSHTLYELREIRALPSTGTTPCWGTGRDLRVPWLRRPHAWAIEQIPFLRHLQQQGLIAGDNPLNAVYGEQGPAEGAARYAGVGLAPPSGIRFAVRPVSDGRRVAFQEDWLPAWHGTSLFFIEPVIREGLRPVGKKRKIWLSPSFQYAFCLYCLPDLLVDRARFRLVVEVRVKPWTFREHGDHYSVCAARYLEPTIPEDCTEWELGTNAHDVQVVGLVLKQLSPEDPSLRHDTNVQHACRALLHL